MKSFNLFLSLAFVVGLSAGIQDVSAQVHPKHEMKCEENFKDMDTDKDGKVSLKEFTTARHPAGKPEEIFKSRDADKDGFLTLEEFCSGHGKGMGKGK